MSRQKKQARAQFRDAVFRRDGYRCRMCGFASTPARAEAELDAHHITDRTMMPSGGYVPENGITLCKGETDDNCHAKAERHHRGEPCLPGFAPAELYRLIGSSHAAALAAARKN